MIKKKIQAKFETLKEANIKFIVVGVFMVLILFSFAIRLRIIDSLAQFKFFSICIFVVALLVWLASYKRLNRLDSNALSLISAVMFGSATGILSISFIILFQSWG